MISVSNFSGVQITVLFLYPDFMIEAGFNQSLAPVMVRWWLHVMSYNLSISYQANGSENI